MITAIRIGNYIFYPAFFVLVISIFVVICLFIIIRNVTENRKNEKKINENYEITVWQRKYLCDIISNYLNDNNMKDAYEDTLSQFRKYINNSKYWNLEELLAIKESLVREVTLILFEAAQTEYEDGDSNDAVLILHAIDFINGGMDNSDYFGGDYPWIGDDIPELRNHQDMTEEEARTLHLYECAIEDLYAFVDEDLNKIPETVNVLVPCRRLSGTDMQDASKDIFSVVDILELKETTRDVVIKALFNNISSLLGGIFGADTEVFDYVDEYRRYSIRALAAAIDGQLYSDVINTIEV